MPTLGPDKKSANPINGFRNSTWRNIFPNPVSQFLNLEYVLPDRGELRIKIYNQMGQPVLKQVSAFMEEGIYKIQYNTSGLSPGLYHYEFVLTDCNLNKL